LTKATKTIIIEDNGASLGQCIAELEVEKNTLQHAVDNGIEYYDLLLEVTKGSWLSVMTSVSIVRIYRLSLRRCALT
jgi:hypothetical protein